MYYIKVLYKPWKAQMDDVIIGLPYPALHPGLNF
jgi:hypothetical protein